MKKILLVLGIILALLVTSPAYAGKLRTLGKLTVYDANGKRIGKVIGIDIADFTPADVWVAFKMGGQMFVLRVSVNSFYGNTPREEQEVVYFESTDCSGTPFIQDVHSPLPSVVVSAPGKTIYIAEPDSTPEPISHNSKMTRSGHCYSYIMVTNAYPAVPLIDLDTVFTPPFSVQ